MTTEEFEEAYFSFAKNAECYPDVITTEEALRKMSEINNWEYLGNKHKALILDKNKAEYISVNYGVSNLEVIGHRVEGPLQMNFNYEEFKKSIIVFENLKDFAKGENN